MIDFIVTGRSYIVDSAVVCFANKETKALLRSPQVYEFAEISGRAYNVYAKLMRPGVGDVAQQGRGSDCF